MAVTVVVAGVAAIALALLFGYLVSTDESVGCSLHQRILQAVPGEAVKIIIVTWQIVTQVRPNRMLSILRFLSRQHQWHNILRICIESNYYMGYHTEEPGKKWKKS